MTYEPASTEPRAPSWWIAATTGMRRGEVLGLRWTDVDLEAGQLSISQTITLVAGEPRVGEPKTRSGRRQIALDPTTVAALRRHRAPCDGIVDQRIEAGQKAVVPVGFIDSSRRSASAARAPRSRVRSLAWVRMSRSNEPPHQNERCTV